MRFKASLQGFSVDWRFGWGRIVGSLFWGQSQMRMVGHAICPLEGTSLIVFCCLGLLLGFLGHGKEQRRFGHMAPSPVFPF